MSEQQNQLSFDDYINNLPLDLKNKVNYLLDNPTSRIIRLSDPQKGSSSNQLFGLLNSIDMVKPILMDILNFKISVNEYDKFFEIYGKYAKNYKDMIDILKRVENDGVELLKFVNEKRNIKNKRLRERVFNNNTKKPKK